MTQTHCRKGHELTEATIYVARGRYKRCRTCSRICSAAYRARQESIPSPDPEVEYDGPRTPEETAKVASILHKMVEIIDRATAKVEL